MFQEISRAARAAGLHVRNWSSGKDYLFAVYQNDGYLGTVRPTDGSLVQDRPWFKRDKAHFDRLVTLFRGAP
jgi:hypothetical protein